MKRAKKGQKTFMDLHQPSVASISDVVKSGYLMKEGGSYKSWKSRYFVVDGSTRTMYYYSKPKDKKPLGFIPLWDCKVEPNVERAFSNCFEVAHPDRRTFYMIAASSAELNEWVDALRRVVRDGAKQRKQRVTAFWEGAFQDEASVKWSRFCEALKEHVRDSFDRSTEDKVHFVLATLALKSQPKDEVHVGQLHLFTELLGPISSAYRNLGEICLWYHGALTSSDAESRLAGQPEGTFLLRLRRFAADSGLLALSLVGKKGISHTNIYKEPVADVYYTGFNEAVYVTVQDLIRAHSLCIRECESQVARDYFKQFEAARLTTPDGSSGSAFLGVDRDAEEAVSQQAMSPRVPMQMGNSSMKTSEGSDVDFSRAVTVALPKSSVNDDVSAAAQQPQQSLDGGPIVVAVSGETTFDSMHQPNAASVSDVIHSGWLIRELRDEELGDDEDPEVTQQRCFFVLSGQLKTLYYFESPESDEPVGFVPLWGCDISETPDAPVDGCFEVSHPDRPSFFLQASDEIEMNDWANALLTVIDEWKVEQARKRERFWREHFGTRKEVSWDIFVDSLQKEVGKLSQREELQLRFMVGTFAAKNQSPDTIKSRQLYLFIELFGSLSQCCRRMDRVCLWYQGSLTSSDAQARLAGQREGTFLLRLRRFAADSGLLAMSFVQDGQPQHINIFRDPLSDCYYLVPGEPVFASIEELVVGHPELHALPSPGLGRAFREFLERNEMSLDDVLQMSPLQEDFVNFAPIVGDDNDNVDGESRDDIGSGSSAGGNDDDDVEEPDAALNMDMVDDSGEEDQEALREEKERIEEEEREERDRLEQEERERDEEALNLEEEAREREEQERARQEEEALERKAEELEEQKRVALEEAEHQQRIDQERYAAERQRIEDEEQQRVEAQEQQRLVEEASRQEAEERERQEAERKRLQEQEAERQSQLLEEQKRLAETERQRQRELETQRRQAEERERQELARHAEERQRADAAAAAEQERQRRQQQQEQTTAKTDQQIKVERQKALIEQERKQLEAERQAKLARLARDRGGSTPSQPSPKTMANRSVGSASRMSAGNRLAPKPPAKQSPVMASQRAEPELEDPINYSTAAAYPAFAKETKVERLYKERMMQARSGQPLSGPPAGGPDVSRQSAVIKVDVEKVKEILLYLSEQEEDEVLTEDEVYELESLVTVKRDQMVLGYYMTFKDSPAMFAKRCRRHLKNLNK